MHLLMVVPAFAPFVGGAQTLCRMLAAQLVADGHGVTVLTTNAQEAEDFWRPPTRQPLPNHEMIRGVSVVRLPLVYPWPAPWHFGVLRRASHSVSRLPVPVAWREPLLRYLARFMPPLEGYQPTLSACVAAADGVMVVDAAWDGLFVGAAQAAFAQSKPVFAVPLIHMGSPAMMAGFGMAHQLAVYRQATATIALTPPEATVLVEWGVSPPKLHCVPLGVEALKSAEAKQMRHSVNKRYGLPSRYLLFLGAATYDKGALTLAQAMAELAQAGHHIHAVFAGSHQGALARFLETMPTQLGNSVRQRVHLLGMVDEPTKHALLAGCLALVLPSRVDSFGIVLLEAWQHGKPVIAAAIGGPAAIVTHDETGLLVGFDAPDALAEAIRRMADEADLADRLGAAGREVVNSRYTWQRVYHSFEQLFSQACRPSAGGHFGHTDERF